MTHLKELPDGLLDLIFVGLGMSVGSGDNCLYSLLKHDDVLEASIWWPAWRNTPKNPVMLVQNGLYVHQVLLLEICRILGCDKTFRGPLNIMMPKDCLHPL